jgi:nucleoside-diphosphate-sugar epimerase
MLLIFGLGYSGRAVADAVPDFNVMATSRSAAARVPMGSGTIPAGLNIHTRHGPAPPHAHQDNARSETKFPPPSSPGLTGGPVAARQVAHTDARCVCNVPPARPEEDGGGRKDLLGSRPYPNAYAAPPGHLHQHDVESGGPLEPGHDVPVDLEPTFRPVDITLLPFDAAGSTIALATHILVTIPPDEAGDPVLNRYAHVIRAAPGLCWIGYLSSTVVYGDRNGAWVDEDTPPAPSQPRGQRRLEAELAWSRFADRCAVDIFRLGGIYGPGRSAFDDLRAGTARRMTRPGHQFGRIHRDDIGRAVAAALRQARDPATRVLNLTDDVPAESAAVVTEAARLLGVPPPPEMAFADVVPSMSPMARSFWAENRKVGSRKTQQALGLRWLYPSFREGLAAIWRQESGDRPA